MRRVPIILERMPVIRVAKRFQWLWWVGIALSAVLVLPYGYSRLASARRCVSLHADAEAEARSNESGKVRIACYNIAHGRGLATSNWQGGTAEERLARLAEISALLRTLDADIVVINEVDFACSWSQSVNQAAYLAQHAGYPYWVEQRNMDFRVLGWQWRFGNAILSRYPIGAAELIDLPGHSTIEALLLGKKRGVACTLDFNGQQIRVLGVHLSHRSEATRVQSVRILTQMVSTSAMPTILAGDFNSSPSGFPGAEKDAAGANAMDLLDASALFQRRPDQPPTDPAALTFHATQPEVIIDWILIPRHWQFVSYRVDSAIISDHRPIVADLLMTPPASNP